MPFTEVFAGIAVQDRDAAIEFYERLLGAPPTMLPNEDEAAWQLTTSKARLEEAANRVEWIVGDVTKAGDLASLVSGMIARPLPLPN